MTRLRYLSIILMLLALQVSPLKASSIKKYAKTHVALLDFTGNNVPEGQSENVKNRILLRIINAGTVTVLEPRRTRDAVISQNNVIPDYTDRESAARIGRYLLADYVIFGTLDRVVSTKKFIIYLRVVNSFTGEVVYGDSEEYTKGEDVLAAADSISQRLISIFATLKPSRYADRRATFMLMVTGSYIYPLDTFSHIVESGGSLSIITGIYISDFLLAFGTGCYMMDGSGDNRYAVMVPIQLHAGYTFSLPSRFSLMLSASGGIVYKYLKREDGEAGGYSPMASVSVSPGYALSDSIRLVLQFTGGCVIENITGLWFLQSGIGVEYIY